MFKKINVMNKNSLQDKEAVCIFTT